MKTALNEFRKELDAIRAAGTWRNERIITTPQQSRIATTEKPMVVNLCANNYLGLSDHPALIAAARQHGNYNVLYNEITSGSCREFAPELAREIESRTAQLYTRLFDTAKEAGALAPGLAPEAAAFFFDNLLMMLQFSYSCDYYQHRMRLYCGENAAWNDEMMADQLTRFLLGAMRGEGSCNISLPTTSGPPA